MPDALWAGILAGYAIAIPVGPIAILIFDTGLRRGIRISAAAGAGAASADGFYATLAGLVGTALAPAIGPVVGPARLLGATLLVAIAARGIVAALRSPREPLTHDSRTTESATEPAVGIAGSVAGSVAGPAASEFAGPAARPSRGRRDAVRTYLLFLGLTLANPLTFLYFGALMLGLPAAAAGGDRFLFALGAFASSLSWQLLLASAGALLLGRLPERLQVATRVLGSIVVLAFAASLVLAARQT